LKNKTKNSENQGGIITRIAIVYDKKKPDAVQLARTLRRELTGRGHEIHFGLSQKCLPRIELAITLGGDGLIMNVANRVVDHEIPLLRVNFGHVGFMADIEPFEALEKVLEAVERQNYIIVKKTRLEVLVGVLGSGRYALAGEALNDIIIERLTTKIVTCGVRMDDEDELELRGDGVIVCTKNGSTAYNVSAGGRPLFKEHFLGLKVISPTAGASPSQFIREDTTVFLIRINGGKARLVADDKTLALMAGQEALIRKSHKYTYFVEVGDTDRIGGKA